MNKISLQDYEGLHYDKEKLREACKLPVPKGLRLYSLSSSWVGRFIRPHVQECGWRREGRCVITMGVSGDDTWATENGNSEEKW